MKYLLSTGGWDSSYRLLNLALEQQVAVQPHYVIDPGRRSTTQELRAMSEIEAGIEAEAGEADLVRPLQIRLRTDIHPHAEITRARDQLAREVAIGEQYEWLARFCEQENLQRLELSLTGHEAGTALHERLFTAPQHGEFRLRRDYLAYQLFKYYEFPQLSLTKEDMKREAERKGFSALLERTLFCHAPILDSLTRPNAPFAS